MTELTKKGVEFTWGGVETAEFVQLKTALMPVPVLYIFDELKLQEVWVDASDYAVGATLVQPLDCRKHWLPVEYLLHKLSAVRQRYNATNRKFVAIVSGLKRWRYYLLGTHFVNRSDYKSLRYLQT